MPRYRFTGFHETVLTGLSHGVNAELHRIHDHDGCDCEGDPTDHGQPDESTVVAQYGDEITTTEPYPHSLMVNVDTDVTDLPAFAVGEQGPELLSFPEGAEVMTAEETVAEVKRRKRRAARPPAQDEAPSDPPIENEPTPATSPTDTESDNAEGEE